MMKLSKISHFIFPTISMNKMNHCNKSVNVFQHILLGALFMGVAFLSGCYYDNEEELYQFVQPEACDTTNVTYTSHILPLLEANCLSCHDASTASGNVILEGYNQVKIYSDNGAFLGTISHSGSFSNMPQGGNKLPDCDIDQVRTWIEAGAQNN